MNNNSKFSFLICTISALTLLTGCEEDKPKIPVLTTREISNITSVSAITGGIISNDGGASIVSRGVEWSLQLPVTSGAKTMDGKGSGSFTSNITGLIPNTLYYVRAYATNSAGTGFGELLEFTSLEEIEGIVTDIEGNLYHTIDIGTQVWMVENLKVTKYRNGDDLPEVTELIQWNTLSSGAYCNLLNDPDQSEIYGKLYNWYAVNDSRNLAPSGWHIPTDEEFTTLTSYLGGEDFAGGKMKEAGSSHWCNTNTGATNESGFTALPGGIRSHEYDFLPGCDWGFWWTSTSASDSTAYNRIIFDWETIVSRVDNNKKSGYSVRCIKD